MDRNPQVAIITGAGSGIGRATAGLLGTAGFRLALVGRTQSTLQQTMDSMTTRGLEASRVLIVPADVSRQVDAHRVIDQTMDHWGRIDVLINNAALLHTGPITQISPQVLERTFAVNFFGPMHLIARAWPVFQRQRSGCVVNISSMSTVDPFPGLSAYAASKCALESLARSIRCEDQSHAIRAFNIAPGAVETDMLRSFVPASHLPPSGTLDPRDVAKVILECVQGLRDSEQRRTILLPNPSPDSSRPIQER